MSIENDMAVAIITGASSGIGEEYGRRLAAQGLNLLITARRENLLNTLKKELENTYGVQVEVMVANLAKQEDIERLTRRVSELENIQYLINNAGFATVGSFENIPLDKHRDMLTVHINAAVELVYTALPSMIKNNAGVIINVASIAGLVSRSKGGSIYSPSKAFLVYFSHSLHNQVKNSNIVVQALCPGFTYSGFHKTEEFKNVDVYNTSPKFLWLTSERVVSISLKNARKKKVVVIPGLRYRILRRLINWGIILR